MKSCATKLRPPPQKKKKNMPHACWIGKNLAVEPRVLVNKESSQDSQTLSLVLRMARLLKRIWKLLTDEHGNPEVLLLGGEDACV